MGKIVIFDRNDTLLSVILSKVSLWLGWRVIALKAPNCRGVELFEASQLSNMKTSNMYNMKGEFLEHYLENKVDQNLSALQRGHLVAVTQFDGQA